MARIEQEKLFPGLGYAGFIIILATAIAYGMIPAAQRYTWVGWIVGLLCLVVYVVGSFATIRDYLKRRFEEAINPAWDQCPHSGFTCVGHPGLCGSHFRQTQCAIRPDSRQEIHPFRTDTKSTKEPGKAGFPLSLWILIGSRERRDVTRSPLTAPWCWRQMPVRRR